MRGEPAGNSKIRALIVSLVGLAIMAVATVPSSAYTRPGTSERVNVSTEGKQGESVSRGSWSLVSDISLTGRYVAFTEAAPNLVAEDAIPGTMDVFVRDRAKQTTQLVSRATSGVQGVGGTGCPVHPTVSISGNGRFVAFDSDASNLVPGDSNDLPDVFVHDLKTGVTERVSVATDGTEAAGSCPVFTLHPSISDSGHFISFVSTSDNLVPDDSNGVADVFVHDRRTDLTTRVSVASDGTEGNAAVTTGAYISRDGRYSVFTSSASNLVDAPDLNLIFGDVFLHDMKTHETTMLSVRPDGVQGDKGAYLSLYGAGRPISRNNRFVAFGSAATNLVPSDQNYGTTTPGLRGSGFAGSDVFVLDRRTKRIERVSVYSWGGEGSDLSGDYGPSISADGRLVAFETFNSFDADDTGITGSSIDPQAPGDRDVYIYDRAIGTTEMASRASDGVQATGGSRPGSVNSFYSAMSSDGRFTAFSSDASNLADGDTNDLIDIFVRDRGSELGVGSLTGSPGDKPASDESICIPGVICIPPGAAVISKDSLKDIVGPFNEQGANLYGASVAYRPQFQDLFAAIELEYMPRVLPSVSPIFYGLRFNVEDKSYEVRAAWLLGGTFGLFDCTDQTPTCTKVADLRGGYGTTGMRVVFSLPLDEIGLEGGGKLKDVKAFSALGFHLSGATKVLDSVAIR